MDWVKIESTNLAGYQCANGTTFNVLLENHSTSWKNHHLFHNRIFDLGMIHCLEQIRVVDEDKILLLYDRLVAIDENPAIFYGSGILNRIVFKCLIVTSKVLNFFLKKSRIIESSDSIKNSEYMNFPFVENLFVDVVRNKKLESLGIL